MTGWTPDLVMERLEEAYRTMLRVPVVSPRLGEFRAAGLSAGRDDHAIAPLGWLTRYLGLDTEEKRFLLRHLRWTVEGYSIRYLVEEARTSVWEHRSMSWSSYKRKRREICATIIAGLGRDGIPAEPPRLRVVKGAT